MTIVTQTGKIIRNDKTVSLINELSNHVNQTQRSNLEREVLGTIILYPELYIDNQHIIDTSDFFNNELHVIIFNEFLKTVKIFGGIDEVRKNQSYFSSNFITRIKDNHSDDSETSKNVLLKLDNCLVKSKEEIDKSGIIDTSTGVIKPNLVGFSYWLKELLYYQKERVILNSTLNTFKEIFSKKFKALPFEKKNSFLIEYFKKSEELLENDGNENNIYDNMKMIEVFQQVTDPTNGIKVLKTGIPEFDKVCAIGGEKLVIIGGRPSMGKTSFALSIWVNLLKQGRQAMFFSLEMSVKAMVVKLGNLITKTNLSRYRNEENGTFDLPVEIKNQVELFLDEQVKTLFLIDKPAIKINEIKQHITQKNLKARMMAREEWGKTKEGQRGIQIPESFLNKYCVEIVFIDYLQIFGASSNPNKKDREYISEITRELKKLTIELNIPIVLLSQLNRNVTYLADKRPTMADLKESGSIEQDADIVLLLHRECYYHKSDATRKISKEEYEFIELISEVLIDKQRDGETGTVYLNFDHKSQEFTSLQERIIERELEDGSIEEVVLSPSEVKKIYKEICNKVVNGESVSQPQNQQIDINKCISDLNKKLNNQQQPPQNNPSPFTGNNPFTGGYNPF